MSGYKSFAVWHAGRIGVRITKELLKLQATGTVSQVIVLARPDSVESEKHAALAAQGAKIVPYEAAGADAVSALRGIDVLISTGPKATHEQQYPLMRAALEADVKLFVPGEWGDVTDGRTERRFASQAAVRAEASKLGLPTAAFYHGAWIEYFPYYGYDLKAGKITVQGEGNAPLSVVSMDDVGRFVAYVLTAVPREKLQNASVQFEGERVTWNSVAAALQKASSKPLEITHRPRTDFEQQLAVDPDDILSQIFLGWDTGKGALPGPLWNAVWPDWKPKTTMDILGPMLA